MASFLSFDLGELWGDFKGIINDNILLWTDPSEAPPTIRNLDAAFMALKTRDNKPVGTFVPELYELAKVGGLKAQQAEAKWLASHPRASEKAKKAQAFYKALYNEDGTKKSPFELAVLPVIYDDQNNKSARPIQKRIEDEFNNRIAQGQALPPTVYKYQIKSDYLRDLHLLNLQTGGPRGIKLNLINPGPKTTIPERATHYIAQRTALLATLLAMVAVTAGTPMLLAASAIGVMLAKWCGEEFGLFDLGETLLRDIRSNFSKDFRLGEKISVKKTIKTAVLLAALGVAAAAVVSTVWSAMLGMSLWAGVTNTLGATAATGLKYAIAGYMSFLGGLGTLVGGSVGQRFFWGLGIWDKQIDFAHERAPKVITRKQVLAEKLAKWQHKLEAEVQLQPKRARQSAANNVNEAFTQLRAVCKVRGKEAANDEQPQRRVRARVH